MTIMDKEIVKNKIRNLHILTQEQLKLRNNIQITDAIHDIADVLVYLFEQLEQADKSRRNAR